MKRVFLSFGVALVLALMLMTCAPQTRPAVEEAASTEANVEAIQALCVQWSTAVEAGDIEALLALYTDDAVKMPPDGPSYSGKAAFEEFYRSIFETFSVEGVWPVEGTEEIIVADDWAFHLSEYILFITPNEGGETMEEKGKVVEILQRQPDGSWKFAREIWNVAPPPEAE